MANPNTSLLKRKHPGGRPTKLTLEVQKAIVDALAAGTYLETAAAAAGIERHTLLAWLKKGAVSASGKQKEFSTAVKKALANAEIRFGATIAVASQAQWQAAAWLLERRYPDRWGRIERHELTGEGGGPVQMQIIVQSEKQRDMVAQIVEGRMLEEGEP